VTKRRDDPELPEAEEGGTTSERRRRRRRGAGLRVPSDNVPRRTQPQPVVAPVPEDPNLAVSIAYSFSAGEAPRGEAGGPAPAVAPGVPRTAAALTAAAATSEALHEIS
jgi:hypothetical protein